MILKDLVNGKILMQYKIKKISGDASFREFYKIEKNFKSTILVKANKDKFKNLIVYAAINEILIKRKSKLDLIKCYFPNDIDQKKYEEISSLKFSFVHADFDLYRPTLDVIKFIIPRLEKNAILLLDDYNLINQEGVKWAVRDSGINIDKCVQTQSGQLICYT